jgi:hypothetical protein
MKQYSDLGKIIRAIDDMLGVNTLRLKVCASAPNKSLQRSGSDKVLGRGRGGVVPKHVWCARVLKGQLAAAELGR